jgi:hypothetical protein
VNRTEQNKGRDCFVVGDEAVKVEGGNNRMIEAKEAAKGTKMESEKTLETKEDNCLKELSFLFFANFVFTVTPA